MTRQNNHRHGKSTTSIQEFLKRRFAARTEQNAPISHFHRRVVGYCRYLAMRNYSPATIIHHYYSLMAFADWVAEKHGIGIPEQLTPRQLRSWQKDLAMRRTCRGTPLAVRTLNKYVLAIRCFLKYLNLPKRKGNALLRSLVLVKEPKPLPSGILTHRQMRKLLNSVDTASMGGYRTRTILEILYSTGIRAGELLGLDLEDVDLRSETILVFGKGSKERLVPLGATAGGILSHYLREIRPSLVAERNEDAVFVDTAGKRMPYHTLRRLINGVVERSGLGIRVTAHAFRRTCTTEMIRAGAGLYHLKELLGHESLDMLLHYAKLSIQDLKRVHRKFHPRERDDISPQPYPAS